MAKKTNENVPAGTGIDQEKALPFLVEGNGLLARRRFEDAIDVLREGAKIDRRNPEFFSRIGIASLFLDYLDDAERYFDRALQLDPDHEEAKNGLLFVYMRTDRVSDATEMLCDVIKRNPKNRKAKKNFTKLKSAESVEKLLATLHPEDFVTLPRQSRIRLSDSGSARLRYVSLAVILLGVLALLGRFGPRLCTKPPIRFPWGRSDQIRDPLYPGNLPLHTDIGQRLSRALTAARDSGLVLGDGEGSQLVARIKGLIDNQEYNEGRYYFNKILASQPDDITLTMASNIGRFLREPDPAALKFNPRVDEIAGSPWLFPGVHVKWFSRAVQLTNGFFLQVAPARYHNGTNDNIDVVVVGRNIPPRVRGRKVEVFGDVLGVDRRPDGGRDLVFIRLKQIREF